jgi:hypothetical protein
VLERLRRDCRGVTAIAYMLILPIFIVLVFGVLEIWKVMAVKQSLYLGAYKAARVLSWEGRSYPSADAWQWEARANDRAKGIIAEELNRNALLPQGYTLNVSVSVEAGRRGSTASWGWLFGVRAELISSGLTSLSGSGGLTLVERQVSFIDGPNADWRPWVDLPEGWPY